MKVRLKLLSPRKIRKLTPIRFIKSSAEPILETPWVAFRDSLMGLLASDNVLQIEGKYFEDEANGGDTDLGMVRARNVLKLFKDLPENKAELKSGSKGSAFTKDEANNLIAFRFLRRTEKIKEIDDRTLIYFPFNSTRKISDAEIEQYLTDVTARVKKSGEKIKLVGHTDSIGNDDSNKLLGLWRAEVIRDVLISKGLPASQIIVSSQGEANPIASNATDSGRAKNRRVELQIIN